MHPELLRALARARHEDLLDEHRARGHPQVRVAERSPRFPRARRRVGSMLIGVGARLVGETRPALGLAHE
jgi:hypothetical protein